jgi:beta-lactamase class A
MKGEGMEKMFEGPYRAQAAWDEVMAANVVRGAEAAKGKMIVLAGSGHLLYNLGLSRRVYERNRLPFKTVVAVSLSSEEKTVSVSRSMADYIWGIAEQERPAYPAVGLAFKKVEGLENPVVERKPFDGTALDADFEKGDVVLAVDGKPFDDINELRIHLSAFKWEEEVKFRLLRGGETREVVLKFQPFPLGERKTDKDLPPEKKMAGQAVKLKIERLKKQVENLINLMMLISDNSATDILLHKVGAANVTRRMRELAVEGISVDRSCQELIMNFVGLDYEMYKGLPLDQVTAELRKARSRNREEHRLEVKKFGQNPEDQSTPLGMNLLLEKIFKKEILDQESCDFILSVMLRCQTGAGRIRGGLPEGTALAHKTGTIAGTVNDCGIIYLPDDTGHIVLTVLTKDFADTKTADVEEIIAGTARSVYDYFYFTNSARK